MDGVARWAERVLEYAAADDASLGAIEIPPHRWGASNLSPRRRDVYGIAAGGGCQLALGCDLIIASQGASSDHGRVEADRPCRLVLAVVRR